MAAERAWANHHFMVLLMNPNSFRHAGTVQWSEQAACHERPDLPWDGDRADDTMREICAGCPVRQRCLAEALRQPTGGVWAGTTPKDRRRLLAG